MICYKCGTEVQTEQVCPSCGADLRYFQKAVRISNAYYNDGLEKAGVRNLSGAIISLRTCLKFNKYHIDARNLLGLVYYEMGEVVDALSEWVISKSYQTRDNRASVYLDEIQQNQAHLSAVNQTIKKYNQALLYCKQDSRDLAIIQLKKVLSLNPKLIKGHQLLALLYIQEGKLEQAKKSLRNAGKIDTDNTLTLRYLKEVNTRLRESSGNNKPKQEDLISYQSGNETIIMPKRFKESSLGTTLLYIVLGLVIGVAVTTFLVVPGVRRTAVSEANKQLLEANDTITTSSQTITDLENQIEELKAETESAANASQLVQLEVDAYEKLLNAYVAYAADDVITAGDELAEVDVSYLSENAAGIYSEIETVVNEQYLSTLFEEGYQAYSSGDYETAITDLQAVVDVDEDYRDGYAAYYLAQTFRRNDNLEAAIPYYQYLVDNYPGTERARTAAAYVD
jgi:tetratricopeptide (TPR) repeat protein